MKLNKLVVAVLALAAPFAIAQTSTWKSDAAHSEVDFTIKHLSVSNVHGRFGHVDATIVLDEKDITKSTVTATIDVTGVSTGESARDNHLSTSVAKSPTGLTVAGNLTIAGVTKPVVLNVEGPTAPQTGMDKKQHVGFSATTTLSRTAFGLGVKFPEAILSDAVKVSLDLDVAKQ